MIKYFVLIFISIVCAMPMLNAQSGYAKVKIDIRDRDVNELAKLGIEIDHGVFEPNRSITNIYSYDELKSIEEAGFSYKMVIADVQEFFNLYGTTNQNYAIAGVRSPNCNETFNPYDYETPENYVYGSMAGYLTYAQALTEMDRMSELYPNLITKRDSIGTIKTHEDRSLYYLRISSDVNNLDPNKPQILYTSLHHAREPNSLSQNIFFMWYLLENYNNDEEVKYLVDNSTLFFMPIINPDGYVYNETTNPNGGGFWRKNRYVNADEDTVGVDLNRNYGFFWAVDDIGSSPDEFDQTYRGPGPFSEPETQAVKQLCIDNNFQITLNYHTSGNLLIHPWGYSDMPTSEHDVFQSLGEIMIAENDFVFGTGTETVGYVVNGDSDDWFYGDETEKNKIYAYTPEVGPSFWPGQNNIDFLNKSNVRMNLNAAHLLHNFGWIEEQFAVNEILGTQGSLFLQFEKSGLKDGSVTFGVESLSPGVSLTDNIESNSTLAIGDLVDLKADFVVDSNFSEDTIHFVMFIDNGDFRLDVPLTKLYRAESPDFEVLLEEDLSSLDNFEQTVGAWDLTDEDFVSASYSLTDSPNSRYANNTMSEVTFLTPIDLSEAVEAHFNFMTKFEIEADWDYVQILGSSDGVIFEPLCGDLTNPAVPNQLNNGSPVYDGFVTEWTPESVCLDNFLGEEAVIIKFSFFSDQGVREDGFYIDDVNVQIAKEVSSNIEFDVSQAIMVSPNPTRDYISVHMDRFATTNEFNYSIYDGLGKLIRTGFINTPKLNIPTSNLKAGNYVIKFESENGYQTSTKFIKQ